jgi:fructokinase
MHIGIDLGGTKIEAIALDGAAELTPRKRVPTPRTYDGTVAAIRALVLEIETETAKTGTVGVGIPGTISAMTGLVKNANSTWLNGRPFRRDLEAALSRPVAVANDANCFAVSEAVDGAAQGARVVFGVILGTGVGGGLVIGQRALEGINGIAGEWGHNPLPWPDSDELPGPPCYCGKRGCIETFLSGPGFERDYAGATGERASAKDIMKAASKGIAAAADARRRYEHRLAKSLATVINVCDPDVIVLGGGMSNTPGLAERVEALLPRWVFSDSVATRVVPNMHGDSSGVRGAAWLARPARSDPRT